MTKLQSSSSSAVVVILSIIFFIYRTPSAHAIGSGGTLAISYGSATVCGIIASQPRQSIQCYRRGQIIPINPNVNFSSISGGQNFFCGLRSGGYSLLCWDTTDFSGSSFDPQRVYFNDTVVLGNLSVGNNQVCATVNGTGSVNCWRGDKTFRAPSASDKFVSISSGIGFSCGILRKGSQVRCWGSNNATANLIQREFGSIQMASIVAGGSHVCGLNSTGFVFCKGNNYSGQLNVPSNSAWEFSTLALGANHSCGIRGPNYSVVCWGGGGEYSVNVTQGVSFATIASGSNFTCGLTNGSFSITCWGPGWAGEANSSLGAVFPAILPGPCDNSSCSECGLYPESQYLCSGFGNICKPCFTHISTPPPPPPPPPLPPPPPPLPPPLPMPPVPLPLGPTGSARPSPSKGLRKGLLAFCIVGSVGIVAGICTIVYCFWTGVCLGKKKVHNSVQPTIARAPSSNNGTASNNSPPSRSSTIRRPGSLIMRRQRSGTSTTKHADRAEEFSLAELAAATNSFSLQNKLGAGSFGIVYRGKLSDGREVAIKRGETGSKTKKFQEKESAFDSELAFLSRLHHKHLVRLVGYCEEKDEKLLVYDYMKNGALYDHIHDKNNVEKSSSVLNSWRMRIKVALDAARGIEYLHNYAVPSIIHRDIKSSNILLDANWTARVSDFGLSLMGPESDSDYRPTKAAGTVGYIDPEYYGLNLITAKSDVYGLGIVLLELLTGKRAIFRNGEDGGTPVSVVDFAVPAIMAGEMAKILDSRVGPPEVNEVEAVELMAYTALHCVNLEGKDRPTMADIVTNLDRALATCDFSHGSISSSAISIVLE